MSQPVLLSTVPIEIAAASTLIPYRRDDHRALYLGYLACGFSYDEALFILGLTIDWLYHLRATDEQFANLEIHVPEFRKELSREYADLDFYRNFRMVMEKDHKVLRKSLNMELGSDGEPAELTPFEEQYLLKLRSAYTPQQLQLIESVAGRQSGDFNFARWAAENADIITASRTETITMRKNIGKKTEDNE